MGCYPHVVPEIRANRESHPHRAFDRTPYIVYKIYGLKRIIFPIRDEDWILIIRSRRELDFSSTLVAVQPTLSSCFVFRLSVRCKVMNPGHTSPRRRYLRMLFRDRPDHRSVNPTAFSAAVLSCSYIPTCARICFLTYFDQYWGSNDQLAAHASGTMHAGAALL